MITFIWKQFSNPKICVSLQVLLRFSIPVCSANLDPIVCRYTSVYTHNLYVNGKHNSSNADFIKQNVSNSKHKTQT